MTQRSTQRPAQRRRLIPLRAAFIIPFVLQLLATVGFLQWLVFRTQRQAVHDLAGQLRSEVSKRVEVRLNNYLEETAAVAQINANALALGQIDVDDLRAMQLHFLRQSLLFEDVSYIYFGSIKGEYISVYSNPLDERFFEDNLKGGQLGSYNVDSEGRRTSSRQPLFYGTGVYDPRTRPWYRNPLAVDQTVWTDIYNWTTVNRLGVTLSHPYFDKGGRLRGVLGVDLSQSRINSFLSSIKVGMEGKTFIVEDTGALVASSSNQRPYEVVNGKRARIEATRIDDPLIQTTANHLKRNFDNTFSEPQKIEIPVRGDRYFVQVTPLQDRYGLNWALVVVVPESDFTAQIDANQRNLLLLCLIPLGISVIGGVLLARRFSEPLRQLARASKALADAREKHSVQTASVSLPEESRIKEIYTLSSAFKMMSQQLQSSYAQLEDYSQSLEIKVKERTQALEKESYEREQSQKTFETLVANIPGVVYRCTCGHPWSMLFVSDSIVEMCGYPASDFVRDSVRAFGSIMLDEDSSAVEENVTEAISNGQPYLLEYRIRDAMGQVRWIYDKGRAIFDDEGEPLYLDGVFVDVTQQKRAEIQIQASEEKYRTLNESTQDAVMLIDETGFIDCNPATLKIFGCDSKQDFDGKTPADFSPKYQPDGQSSAHVVRTTLAKAIKSGTYNFEWMHKRQDGSEFPAEVWLTSMEIDDQRVVQAVIRDITNRKQAEKAIVEAKEAAEAANKTKSEFLANMSHELRSPLNAILGFSELMSRSDRIPKEHQDDVVIIHRSGDYLLSLINDVLDMAKIEAGRTVIVPIDFDLYRLMDDVQAMFKLKAEEKQLQLLFDKPPELPRYINADQGKVRQVLVNLLNNAIKFTKQGTVRLDVSTLSQADMAADSVESNSVAADSVAMEVHFTVTDTGPGIAPHELEEIFKPFVQTQAGRDSQEGTGLGLAISRQFVQLMGGDLALRNRDHQTLTPSVGEDTCGTVASFHIQAQTADADSLQTTTIERHITGLAAGQPHYRLLIVDDKAVNRKLLVKLLEPLGFSLKEAEHGIAAVALAKSWRPHLIWMDLRMPKLDGFGATQEIRKLWDRADSSSELAEPKIVALSATSYQSDEAAAYKAGCDGFIRKPFSNTTIFEALAQHLGVLYSYRDETGAEGSNTVENHELDATALSVLPDSLLNDLESATRRLQWDKILQVIEQVRDRDETLAAALSDTVHNFQYTQIIDTLQTIASK